MIKVTQFVVNYFVSPSQKTKAKIATTCNIQFCDALFSMLYFFFSMHTGTTNEMCRTCTSLPNFASKCAALCGRGLYRDSNNTCTQCPDCEMAGNSTMTNTPTECQKFTDRCLLKCSYSSSSKSQQCRSCHSSSFKWNCTQISKYSQRNKQFVKSMKIISMILMVHLT